MRWIEPPVPRFGRRCYGDRNGGRAVQRLAAGAFAALAGTAVAVVPASNPVYDPVTQDVVVADKAFPPHASEVVFESDGVKLYGVVYSAQGRGLHPTVLYARGFPDTTASNDILRVFQRAGYNVMFFHYRGTSSMSGVFSMQHSYEDLRAALTFLRRDPTARSLGIDPTGIVFYGYSWGGPIALRLAAADRAVRSVMLQDPTDLRSYSSMDSQALADEAADNTSLLAPSTTGKEVISDILLRAADWDASRYADDLAGKNILVAWASRKRDSAGQVPSPV